MRILIADKNRFFRAEFVELITHCHPSWQIADTADVIEFKSRMSMSRFDVVFLDLELPGLQNYLTPAGLRTAYPNTKIIGLGDANEGVVILRCFEDGLGGYIARSSSGTRLFTTLKVIATPDLFISTGTAMMGGNAAEPTPPDSEAPSHPLTARQADVLNLLAEGRSTKDIARRLGLAVPTVKTHLAAVYRQLGARNRLQAVVKASALSAPSPARPGMMRDMHQRELFSRNLAAG